MRHSMLIPLKLLVRDSPPAGIPQMGDMYFDSILLTVQVWDGTKWTGLAGGGGAGGDEVLIDPDEPFGDEEEDIELWVDTDDPGHGGAGAFLPLTGGTLTGTLTLDPEAQTAAMIVKSGGIKLEGPQVMQADYAVSKAYVDALFGDGATFTYIFGDGVATDITIVHNLHTENIVLSLWSTSTKQQITTNVMPYIIDADSLRLVFPSPPAIGSMKIVVMSGGGGGVFDQETADGLYVNITGDSMTGGLEVLEGGIQVRSDGLVVEGTTRSLFEAAAEFQGGVMLGDGALISQPYLDPVIHINNFGQAGQAVDLHNQRVVGMADPVSPQDAATKAYVDTYGGGGGGGGLQTRTTSTITTVSLAPGSATSGSIALANGYRIYRIVTTYPSRTCLYTTTAKRDADASRPIGHDPSGDHGVMFEAITASSLLSFDLSPMVDGFDGKSVPDGSIPYRITNIDAVNRVINVTLTWIKTE